MSSGNDHSFRRYHLPGLAMGAAYLAVLLFTAKPVGFSRDEGFYFEAARHYSPEQVVDALAAILNHLTGEHFGMSYNEATDRERSRTVRAWRVWACYHPVRR